jgi:MHS family alpha-ketoglutarate permease-like MFS transporter
MQKFLVNTAGFPRGTATQVMTAALVIYMLAQPLAGHISDRFGRKPNMLAFGILGTIVTVPGFTMLAGTQNAMAALAMIVGLLLILTAYTAISGLFKAELFPPHIRTLGVALPYAVGNALFGGTAEYVALSFKAAGMESGFYWYVAGAIAITGVVFATLPETRPPLAR